MSARRARDARRAETKHHGLHYRRVGDDLRHRGVTLEVAFAEEWAKENRPEPGFNAGHGILQNLMYGHWDRARVCHIREPFAHGWRGWAKFVTSRRDALIAATVVQWLGTNCGRCFLESALKRAGYGLLHPHETDRVARQAAHHAAERVRLADDAEKLRQARKDMQAAQQALTEATQRMAAAAARLV